LAEGKFITAQIAGMGIFFALRKIGMIAARFFQSFDINNNLEKRRRAMTLVSGLL